MSPLPPISNLPSLPTSALASVLDALFEPCVQLHTLSLDNLRSTPFQTYADLISVVGAQLTALLESASTSDEEWLNAILSAHPRLGEPKVGEISEMSRAEQKQLGGAGEEVEKLRTLNAEYEKAFPGLRYVVFVNGRPRPVIMEDMKRRIERGDLKQEKVDAIKAMCDIAIDRAKKLGAE